MDTKLGNDSGHTVRHHLHIGKHAIGKLPRVEAYNIAVPRGKNTVEHRFSKLKGKTGPNALLHAIDGQAQHKLCDDNAR